MLKWKIVTVKHDKNIKQTFWTQKNDMCLLGHIFVIDWYNNHDGTVYNSKQRDRVKSTQFNLNFSAVLLWYVGTTNSM